MTKRQAHRIVYRSMGHAVVFSLLLCALLGAGGAARAQGAPAGPIQLKPGAQPEAPPPDQQKPSIHMRVSEVSAPVTVVGRNGETVFDLGESDFHIYDNGVEQKIDHFDMGSDLLSVVLVAEDSSRIEALLPAVRQMGIVFTQTVMGRSANTAVIGYDDSVNLLVSFTPDRDAVQSAINHLETGTSGAHLHDAMARAIAMLQEQPAPRRRIIVVVGEGHDAGSKSKLGGVLRAAQLANVTIYSVGLSTIAAEIRAQPTGSAPQTIGPPGTYPVPTPNDGVPQTVPAGGVDLGALAQFLVETGKDAVAANSLEVASKATGGLHVSTRRDSSIQKAIDAIGGELHSEYTLSYHPPADEPGGYHQVKVTVSRPDVTVRTRPGYYLAPGA